MLAYSETQELRTMAQKSSFQSIKPRGAIKLIWLIPSLIIGILAFYFFLYPYLTPDKIRGSVLSVTMAPSKEGPPLLWIVADGSFKYVQSTKTPGRTSIGTKCLFCKTWTYVYDPAREKVIHKIETEQDDIVLMLESTYAGGKVWIITGGYGKNEPRVEAYDAATAQLIMDTRTFTSRYPLLKGRLANIYYNDKEKTLSINTRDGLQGVKYCLETGVLYRGQGEWRDEIIKDRTPDSVAVMARDDSGGPRKKLVLVSGPRGKLADNASSLEIYAASESSLRFFTGATGKQLTEKIFLEGIIYHQDKECAIIMYLDQIGKKANRLMDCYDLATGSRLWTVTPDRMFSKMKIDEEDDSFSSHFFTKDNIKVRRLGGLVVLQLKGVGLMGYDYKTGKSLWTIKI
ncbi:MAG: hypothetical protein KA369_22305 [Spirochaetes bacterium]|nr:hypothetical protein [Spirochaetota bacterium]